MKNKFRIAALLCAAALICPGCASPAVPETAESSGITTLSPSDPDPVGETISEETTGDPETETEPDTTEEPETEPIREETTAAPETTAKQPVSPPAESTSAVTTAPQTEKVTEQTTEAVTDPPAPETTVPLPADEPKGTVEVIDGVTYIDGILIANKTYSLPASYDPGDLLPEVMTAFTEMQKAASADGIFLYIVSGYRSYAAQQYIYNGYVQRDGQAEADRYSARPGYSEHQTGMAIDVNSCYYSFADTKEGKWLAANCHKFGFIIRYPENGETITGYRYEPWHIRWLGTEKAAAVRESGLTLEEYLRITSYYH